MCGIIGIFLKDKDDSFDLRVMDMTRSLAHRGPDDINYQVLVPDRHAIGHTRLSIIDLSLGKQPYHDNISGMTIVYNGELYNYAELRSKLILAGMTFNTNSDTEVVLKAFVLYGEKCLEQFSGMYAFIIHKPDNSYFMARDRFGIKPFYYAVINKGLIAASEIKGILASGLLDVDINPGNLLMQLTYGYSIDNSTCYKGIESLLPGEYMVYEKGKIRKVRYYDIRNIEYGKSNVSFDEAESIFRNKIKASVSSHLVSDVNLVTSLSGGLDSSIVSYLAHRVRSINAYCIGYGREDDEIPFAETLAAAENISLREEIVDIRQLTDLFSTIVYHLEEPIPHTQIGTTFMGARCVRDVMDAKVALLGEGADEILGGYTWAGYANGTLSRIRGKLSAYKAYGRMHCGLLNSGARSYFNIGRHVSLDDAFEGPYAYGYELFREADENRFQRYRRASRDTLHHIMLCDLGEQLPNSQLVRVDKLYMAHSVEARVPFLDHDVVEFVWSLPSTFKLNAMNKWIARRAFKNILPESIRLREKFGARGTQNPFSTWWSEGRLGETLMGEIKNGLYNRGILKRKFIDRITNPIFPNFQKNVLCLGMLEIICKIFMDKQLPVMVQKGC